MNTKQLEVTATVEEIITVKRVGLYLRDASLLKIHINVIKICLDILYILLLREVFQLDSNMYCCYYASF